MSSHDSAPASPNSTFLAVWQGLRKPLHDEINLKSVIGSEALDSFQSMVDIERIRKALTFSLSGQRTCMVPGCLLSNCNLGTHQNYRLKASQNSSSYKKQENAVSIALRNIESYQSDLPSRDGVDGFPTLPIEETLDPTVRSLFHFFFIHTFDKLALLFRGPAVQNLTNFKERMLATALTSPAYCRSLILQARTEQDLNQGKFSETKEILDLYHSTLTAFRELLVSIHKSPHPLKIELALLVTCILEMYTCVYGNKEGQRVHWQGLRDLVAMRGGMHCVTVALAYVIHTDRSCAVMAEVPPTYSNRLTHSIPMPVPISGSPRHESKFLAVRNHLIQVDPTVLDYLVDVSGLVELWVEAKAQNSSMQCHTPRVSSEYLFYIRDRLDEQFAILNAQWTQKVTIERCLLWASRIIEYPCTWSNYVRYIPPHHSHKLATALQQQQMLNQISASDFNTTLWMLFALAVVDNTSDIHLWAITHIQELLDAKHGRGLWPCTWWTDEQVNLHKFVWSSSHYNERFRMVCKEIEQQT